MSTREENHEYALAIIEAKNAEIRAMQRDLGLAVIEVEKLCAELAELRASTGLRVVQRPRAELAQAKLLKPTTGAAHE